MRFSGDVYTEKKHFLGSILEDNNHDVPLKDNPQFPHSQQNNLRIEGANYNSYLDSNNPRQYNVTGNSNTQQAISEIIPKHNQRYGINCVQALPLSFGSTRSGKIWRTDNVDQTRNIYFSKYLLFIFFIFLVKIVGNNFF